MPAHTWIYEDSGPRAGVFNMERDEALARALQTQGDDGVQVLRLYGWEPPAISLGHHQDASTIDQERLQRDGIDLVRRPTGGRAILHHEELTYCVVMLSGRRSILQVYNAISEALVKGLALYGVEVSLQRSQPDFADGVPRPVVDTVFHEFGAVRDRVGGAEAGGECAAAVCGRGPRRGLAARVDPVRARAPAAGGVSEDRE